MSQNAKRCTAPRAFTPADDDLFDAPAPVAYAETHRGPDERSQTAFAFLHDLLNSVGGLHGFLELMTETDDPAKIKKYASNALFLCDSLVEEIEYHRDFLRAETGTFQLVMEETKIRDILKLTALKLNTHAVSKGRTIEIAEAPDESVLTDKIVLSRILVNMTKNAVEATEEGGSVRIGAIKSGDRIRFWVHNDGFIPEDIQDQIFKTSFSSKGVNRGVGMFSILLLGENALGGHVRFESTKERGTYFCIDLPLIS